MNFTSNVIGKTMNMNQTSNSFYPGPNTNKNTVNIMNSNTNRGTPQNNLFNFNRDFGNVKARPTTGAELLRSGKFESKNLLESRRTMTSFTNNLCKELYNDKFMNNFKNICLDELKNSIAPVENSKHYDKSDLPKNIEN